MKTLFLVHVEETFRKHFKPQMIRNIIAACKEYKEVVHFTSMIDADEPIEELIPFITNQVEWGWGYEPECFDKKERKYLIDSLGHEFTWIPPYLRNTKLKEVDIGGGAAGECLTDMESILSYLRIKYNRKPNFIY